MTISKNTAPAKDTQPTYADTYDTSRMIFSDPVTCYAGQDKSIEYKRINISTWNDDEHSSFGDLILMTERLFSFGVSENKNSVTQQVDGWSLPLCIFDRDGATPAQTKWYECFNAIVDAAIDNVMENKEEIDKPELQRSFLETKSGGLSPLFWSKHEVLNDKGKMVRRINPDKGPTLYPKFIYMRKSDSFLSQFYELQHRKEGDVDVEVDPRSYIQKKCYANAALRIESIYIGTKISLQVKVYEAVVEPATMSSKRMFTARPTVTKDMAMPSTAETTATHNPMLDTDHDSDAAPSPTPSAPPAPRQSYVDQGDTGSLDNSDAEDTYHTKASADDSHPTSARTHTKPVRNTRKAKMAT